MYRVRRLRPSYAMNHTFYIKTKTTNIWEHRRRFMRVSLLSARALFRKLSFALKRRDDGQCANEASTHEVSVQPRQCVNFTGTTGYGWHSRGSIYEWRRTFKYDAEIHRPWNAYRHTCGAFDSSKRHPNRLLAIRCDACLLICFDTVFIKFGFTHSNYLLFIGLRGLKPNCF